MRKSVILLSLLALTVLAPAATALAEGAGQYIDDAALTTKVKATLVADKTLDATDVSVTTNGGVVQLSGTVTSHNQETEAVRAANNVSGVKSVQDSLSVK